MTNLLPFVAMLLVGSDTILSMKRRKGKDLTINMPREVSHKNYYLEPNIK